ncbi:MAG: alpha/beta fold hydrolase [Acetivibrio ethanolgignens]
MADIFIHGLGQSPVSWEETISGLDTATDIYCPDLSEMLKNKEISYMNLYTAFSKYCDKISGTINLCGLSLGGVVALEYAIEHPDKIDSLILIAAQYRMPKKLLAFQNVIFKFMPEKMFEEMGFGKEEFIALSKSMMHIDLSRELKKIKCPVLLLCGERDKANKKASVGLSKEIMDSRLMYIENSGHEVNKDNPKKLAEVINEFYA